jgi:hypothetical protein
VALSAGGRALLKRPLPFRAATGACRGDAPSDEKECRDTEKHPALHQKGATLTVSVRRNTEKGSTSDLSERRNTKKHPTLDQKGATLTLSVRRNTEKE